MQDYRKLRVWQKAHQLALITFSVSGNLASPDAWPRRRQMVRAAVSVPSNVAEGAGRGSDLDFARFLRHSLGSLNELEYDLLLARDLWFLNRVEHDRLGTQVEEVRRMLCGLLTQLVETRERQAEQR